jgi:hypothetical protein
MSITPCFIKINKYLDHVLFNLKNCLEYREALLLILVLSKLQALLFSVKDELWSQFPPGEYPTRNKSEQFSLVAEAVLHQ